MDRIELFDGWLVDLDQFPKRLFLDSDTMPAQVHRAYNLWGYARSRNPEEALKAAMEFEKSTGYAPQILLDYIHQRRRELGVNLEDVA